MTPWEWAAKVFGDVHNFFTQGPGHDFLVGAAMFLLVGGLAILFLISSLLLLQSLLPHTPTANPFGEPPLPDRRLRPLYGTRIAPLAAGPAGAREFRSPRSTSSAPVIDQALDVFVANGWGEPRIVRMQGAALLVRMVRCRTCERTPNTGTTLTQPVCHLETGLLARAVQEGARRRAQVYEFACRRQGHPACDFEVTLA